MRRGTTFAASLFFVFVGNRGLGAYRRIAPATNAARARLVEFQREWTAVQVFVVPLGLDLTEAERLSGESRSPFPWPTITASPDVIYPAKAYLPEAPPA